MNIGFYDDEKSRDRQQSNRLKFPKFQINKPSWNWKIEFRGQTFRQQELLVKNDLFNISSSEKTDETAQYILQFFSR